jgi:hypothetical protein
MRLAQAGGLSADDDGAAVAASVEAASAAPASPDTAWPPAAKLSFREAAARRNGLAAAEPAFDAPVEATLPRPEATPDAPDWPAAPRL